MYWQREYLREAASATRGATYKLELPAHGDLGTLLLRLRGTKAANAPLGSVAKWRLIDEIDKIEIIANGAEPIKSLSGTQAQFAAFLDQRAIMPNKIEEYSSAPMECIIPINFGRRMYDRQLALDLTRFDSVELQLTNSMHTDHWADSFQITTQALWLRDAPSRPFGYMRTEDWRSWTTVIDETKYLALPTARQLRRIILQAWPNLDSNEQEEAGVYDLMDDIELSLRTGQVRVYKGGIDDLMRENVLDLGVLPMTYGGQYHENGKGFYTGLAYVFAAISGHTTHNTTVPTSPLWLYQQDNTGTQRARNKTADAIATFLMAGMGYMNCAVFRFDHDDDPGTWLDPDAEKTVELNIHTRNSSTADDGTNSVVLDRLVRY